MNVLANGQVINRRDAAGLKQGYWEAIDREGNLVYAGHFVNDRPVGQMKRYFSTGELRVIMDYDQTSVNAHARFFWPTGNIAAAGKYLNMRRDSVWTYYDQNEARVTSRVEYSDGKRHGAEQRFYPNGKLADQTLWKNDEKDGVWVQYYESGQIKLQASHANNKLQGTFISYYPDGNKEVEGFFNDGNPDKDWVRYEIDGTYLATIKYENGVVVNLEELESSNHIQFRNMIETQQFIPEPTIDDVFQQITP